MKKARRDSSRVRAGRIAGVFASLLAASTSSIAAPTDGRASNRDPVVAGPSRFPTRPLVRPILGDAGGEMRRADGTVDIDGTLFRLGEMGCNTYFYQIWNGPRDWEQLPEFLQKAAARNIQVWVYLIPWSEGKPKRGKNGRDSEPFKQDFVRWGQEIAQLSMKHGNLVGWVMDDFYNDAGPLQYDRFTPQYVSQMRDATRAINPKLQFWPVLYTNMDWPDFAARFGDLVDGAVVCYPRSEAEINDLLGYLRGEPRGAGVLFVAGGDTRRDEPGEFFARVGNVAAEKAREIRFFLDSQLTTKDPNPHAIELTLNGRVLWQREVTAQGFDRRIRVPLPDGLKPRDELRIRLVNEDAWRRELFLVRVSDIGLFDEAEQRVGDLNWKDFDAPGVDAVYLRPTRARQLNIPLMLMPAGMPYQHEKRYQEPPTPENIKAKLALCQDLILDGRAVGMVTWYAPKERKLNAYREAINDVYAGVSRAVERQRRDGR